MAGSSKSAFVVGASRGLGSAFAKVLETQGYHVFAGCKGPADELNGSSVTIVNIDVIDDDSIRDAFTQISSQVSKLDLLINSAGVNSDTITFAKETATELKSLERETFNQMFQINTFGPVMVVKQFLPLLESAKVVNISSNRASFTDRNRTKNYNNYGYSASKVALNMFTRDLAHDLEEQDTSIFAIHPGFVITGMNPTGVIEPYVAATKILATVDKLTIKQSGGYFDNAGNPFPL